MAEPPFDLNKAHHWFGVELNNNVWDWLEKADYSQPHAEQMVHAAHASCFHWIKAGTALNHQRGECLVANAHAAVDNGESAVRHANRSVELLKELADEAADWDFAFTYDGLARALAASGEKDTAVAARQQARDYRDKIAEDGDRKFFEAWHGAGNWHGLD